MKCFIRVAGLGLCVALTAVLYVALFRPSPRSYSVAAEIESNHIRQSLPSTSTELTILERSLSFVATYKISHQKMSEWHEETCEAWWRKHPEYIGEISTLRYDVEFANDETLGRVCSSFASIVAPIDTSLKRYDGPYVPGGWTFTVWHDGSTETAYHFFSS